jgi:hypothetical protein
MLSIRLIPGVLSDETSALTVFKMNIVGTYLHSPCGYKLMESSEVLTSGNFAKLINGAGYAYEHNKEQKTGFY